MIHNFDSKKITVVTVTYNSEKTIKGCIESVLQSLPSAGMVIVDNNSYDKTCEIITRYQGRVLLIKSKENLGFSRANNLAVSKVLSEYIVFLNPDAKFLKKDSLTKLINILIENPDFGVIGPKIFFPDGKIQKTVRQLPTVCGAFKEYILGIKNAYSFYEPSCEKLCEVESVTGACMVTRKDLFLKLGGFNEKYFIYFEDLALCKIIRESGYKVGFAPEVIVEHLEGISGINQKTREFIKKSAREYFGLSYYLIELIFTPRRILNKIKSLFGMSISA